MIGGTYEGHDVDIDAPERRRFLEAMAGQPWNVAWLQANSGADTHARGLVALSDQTTRPPGGCASPPPTTTPNISCGSELGSTSS